MNNNCICCTDCTNCTHCVDCTHCDNCDDCTHCVDCDYCKYCKYCTSCDDCTSCTSCRNCTDCVGLHRAVDAKDINIRVLLTDEQWQAVETVFLASGFDTADELVGRLAAPYRASRSWLRTYLGNYT